MKQYLLVLSLLFLCTLFLNKNAVAQDTAAAKVKIDTVEEKEFDFIKVPHDGGFKGGDSALQKFIEQDLVYPKKAKRKKIQGTVTVEFIVDKFGDISEAKALSGPKELRQSAVDVIMRSPKWDPAIQGGCQVKVYRMYDIVFKLDTASIIQKTPQKERKKNYK